MKLGMESLSFGLLGSGGGRFVNVDFGASSIKIAQGTYNESPPSINLDMADREPVGNPAPNERVEEFSNALRVLMDRNSIAEDQKAVLALPTNVVIVRHLELPAMPDERMSQVIRYEAESHIPFPLEEVVLDYHIIERTDDGTEIILIAVKEEKLNEYVEIAHNAGIDPEIIDISAFSLFNVYRKMKSNGDGSEAGEEEGGEDGEGPPAKVLVDIGHANTDIIIFEGETLHFARSASVAGESITEQISTKLGVDLDEAQELKHEHGHIPLDEDGESTGEDELDDGGDALGDLAEKKEASDSDSAPTKPDMDEESGEDADLDVGAPAPPGAGESDTDADDSDDADMDSSGLDLGSPMETEEESEDESDEPEIDDDDQAEEGDDQPAPPPSPDDVSEGTDEEESTAEQPSTPESPETVDEAEDGGAGIDLGLGTSRSPSSPAEDTSGSPGESDVDGDESDEDRNGEDNSSDIDLGMTPGDDEDDSTEDTPEPPDEPSTDSEPSPPGESAEETSPDESPAGQEDEAPSAPDTGDSPAPPSMGEQDSPDAEGDIEEEPEQEESDGVEGDAPAPPPSPDSSASDDEEPSPPSAPGQGDGDETNSDEDESDEGDGLGLGGSNKPAEESEDAEEEAGDEDDGDDLNLGSSLGGVDDEEEEGDDEDDDDSSLSLGAADNSDGETEEPDQDIDPGKVGRAIKPQVDRLIGELRHTFDYFQSQLGGGEVDEVIIVGGGGNLKNLAPYIEDQLDRPAKKFHPEDQVTGMADGELQQYLVSAGLTLRTLEDTADLEINLIPEDIIQQRQARNVQQKITAMAVLGGLLFVQLLGSGYLFYDMRYRERVKSQQEFEKLESIVNRVEDLKQNQAEMQRRNDEIDRLEEERTDILALMHELNQLPPNVPKNLTWFESFSYSTDQGNTGQLSISGVTGDFDSTSRLYQWLESIEYIEEITSQSQQKSTYTINDQERSLVSFSAQCRVSFATESNGGGDN